MSNTHDQGPRDTDMGDTRDARTVATEETSAREAGRHEGGRRYIPRPSPHYESTTAATSGRAMTARGLTYAAAVLLMLSGAFSFLEGLAAVVRNGFFHTIPTYAYDWTTHGWGWFHLGTGIAVFLVGAALFLDIWWARAIGVAVAFLSAIINLMFIPYLPVWSIVMIALDAVVIWALLTPRGARERV